MNRFVWWKMGKRPALAWVVTKHQLLRTSCLSWYEDILKLWDKNRENREACSHLDSNPGPWLDLPAFYYYNNHTTISQSVAVEHWWLTGFQFGQTILSRNLELFGVSLWLTENQWIKRNWLNVTRVSPLWEQDYSNHDFVPGLCCNPVFDHL